MLYYDKETETFWSQMTGRGVIGPNAGKSLKWIPTEVATWDAWRKRHPSTTVLKPPKPLGSYRGVNRYYHGYRAKDDALFPLRGVEKWPRTYKNKDSVTIIERDGKARCYPHPALKDGENKDGDLKVVKTGITVKVYDHNGKEIPSMLSYWFAWWAFYEDGTVWKPE